MSRNKNKLSGKCVFKYTEVGVYNPRPSLPMRHQSAGGTVLTLHDRVKLTPVGTCAMCLLLLKYMLQFLFLAQNS